MSGQFLVEPDELAPLDPAGGVAPVDPDDPDELLVELVSDVELVVDPEPLLDELVAASAASAPPASKPPVSALTARTLRIRSFISTCLSSLCDVSPPTWGNVDHSE
jgi:hypothetical protein